MWADLIEYPPRSKFVCPRAGVKRQVWSHTLFGHFPPSLYFVNMWLIFTGSFHKVILCTSKINNEQYNHHHNRSLIPELGARSHLPDITDESSDSWSNSSILLFHSRDCLRVCSLREPVKKTPSRFGHDTQGGRYWKQWLRSNSWLSEFYIIYANIPV